jgi:hypothetical protein
MYPSEGARLAVEKQRGPLGKSRVYPESEYMSSYNDKEIICVTLTRFITFDGHRRQACPINCLNARCTDLSRKTSYEKIPAQSQNSQSTGVLLLPCSHWQLLTSKVIHQTKDTGMAGTCIPAELDQLPSMVRLSNSSEIYIKLKRYKTHPDSLTVIDCLIDDSIDISQQVRTLAAPPTEYSK